MAILDSRIGAAVVGYGYWGPNIVRNLVERPEFALRAVCELDEARAAECARRYPGVRMEPCLDAILVDPRITAVAIATPPRTHYTIVKRALTAGKNVMVEKPLATSVREAEELITLAEEQGLVLMPGHTFLYSPPVVHVRQLIADGVLGEPYFVTSSRMNLGIYQQDGVVCDLAPHDISILLYWLDQPATLVSAAGRGLFRPDVPDTAFLTLTFAGGVTASLQMSWLAPRKVRQMVIVGSRRMVQYEDTAADEAVRIYDRGLEPAKPANFGEYRMTYRTGDMVAPRIDAAEPLSLQFEDWAKAIRTGESPRSHSRLGLDVVEVLEAADLSLSLAGQPVAIGVDHLQRLSGRDEAETPLEGLTHGSANGHAALAYRDPRVSASESD